MTGLHLSKTVPEFLASHPEQKFKVRDIAKYIFTAFPEACQAKKSATTYIKTDNDLINQIVAEIGSQRPAMLAKNPKMRTMEGKPRLFYWTNLTDEEEVAAAEGPTPSSKGTDRGLAATVARYEAGSVRDGVLAAARLYVDLRADDPPQVPVIDMPSALQDFIASSGQPAAARMPA